jgi:hypothetical protein
MLHSGRCGSEREGMHGKLRLEIAELRFEIGKHRAATAEDAEKNLKTQRGAKEMRREERK